MIEPKIIFEDSDILVIDKPAGFIVNRADTTVYQSTVQEWVESRITNNEQVATDRESEYYKRGGIVHRLDKETSGILIIAKNEQSFSDLQKQFKEGRVKKIYTALCHGEIKPAEGEVNVPIGRLPWNRMRFGVFPQGRDSKTLYKVLKIYRYESNGGSEPLSLVEVYPQTGRTHQIRVHMQYLKHPIFADELYAGRKVSKRDRKLLPRHFLHATKIRFEHPRTGEPLELESPLPTELQSFIDSLD